MKTTAAVLVELNRPLEILDLGIPKLGNGQVLVEVAFSGVCHTQVLEWRGNRGNDPYLPHCLGHEGSGIVLDIGEGVTKVQVGDHVIMSWIKASGLEAGGTVYNWEKRKINAGPITTFSRKSVISENRLTPIPRDFHLKTAALIGCALPTGLGSVFNVIRPIPGKSIAIFGIGGIGLCATMAAQISGCTPIIAIDINPRKLQLASAVGATHIIDSSKKNLTESLLDICPDGLDFAVEASGQTIVMKQAIEAVRPRGGSVVIIGNAKHKEILEIDPKQLNMGKKILGTWGGDSQPDRDYSRYCKLIAANKLNLDSFLLPQPYPLEEINSALIDLESGKVSRPIIDLTEM